MIKITISEKGGEEKELFFDKDDITIGRLAGNDIVLPKSNISKRHSQIIKREGKIIIIDLKSTNGTFVNGRKITSPKTLESKDKIFVGDYILKVEEKALTEKEKAVIEKEREKKVPLSSDLRRATLRIEEGEITLPPIPDEISEPEGKKEEIKPPEEEIGLDIVIEEEKPEEMPTKAVEPVWKPSEIVSEPFEGLNEEIKNQIIKAVVEGKNIILGGNDYFARLDFLLQISNFIPDSEEVLILQKEIENSISNRKLVFIKPFHSNKKEEDFSLLYKSHRMKRCIVGEIEEINFLTLITSMIFGLRGVLLSSYGNSSKDLFQRLELLLQLRGENINKDLANSLLRNVIELVIIIKKFPSGLYKVIDICEIKKEGKNIFNTLYKEEGEDSSNE